MATIRNKDARSCCKPVFEMSEQSPFPLFGGKGRLLNSYLTTTFSVRPLANLTIFKPFWGALMR